MVESSSGRQLDDDSEAVYCLAWSRLPEFGPRTLEKLLARPETLAELWQAQPAYLRETVGLSDKLIEAWQFGRKAMEPERLAAAYRETGIHLVGRWSTSYPPLLRESGLGPPLLFVRGNLAVLQRSGPALAVVGTRNATDYGRRAVRFLLNGLLPAQPCIVSGLAAGIDCCAHQVALSLGLPTVAVFGTGIDRVFPRSNVRLADDILASGGACISEYGFGVPGGKHTFPERNRIIAGLSHGSLMVEGEARSGAMITARYALEANRTVFAIPGDIFVPNSEGPLRLIQQGAVPVLSARDIAEDLGWPYSDDTDSAEAAKTHNVDGAAKTPSPIPVLVAPDVTPELEREPQDEVLKQVYHCLPASSEPVTMDSLQQACGLPVAELSHRLTILELEGWVVLLPGARVQRAISSV